MYEIRTAAGEMTGRLSNVHAGRVIEKAEGHWETKNFTKGGKQLVYIIDEPFTWGNNDLRLVVQEGFYIRKEV